MWPGASEALKVGVLRDFGRIGGGGEFGGLLGF